MREYKKPVFTQKHYEYLATILGDSITISEFETRLSNKLIEDNPKFDPKKFYAWIDKIRAARQ